MLSDKELTYVAGFIKDIGRIIGNMQKAQYLKFIEGSAIVAYKMGISFTESYRKVSRSLQINSQGKMVKLSLEDFIC